MKNYRIAIVNDENARPMSALDIFTLSDHLSELSCDNFDHIFNSERSTSEKLNDILVARELSYDIFREEVIHSVLTDFFYVDGGIKLSETDLQYLEKSIRMVGDDGELQADETKSDAFMGYMCGLLKDFAYIKGSNFIFRGSKYYFLLNGLKVDIKSRTTSINDYIVEDIDVDNFCLDLQAHYNSVHQHLKPFSTYFLGHFQSEIEKNKEAFCMGIKNVLAPEKINSIRQKIKSGELLVGNKNIDQMYMEQWERTLKGLEYLRQLAEYYHSDTSPHALNHFIEFLTRETLLIENAKIVFGIDLESTFNQFVKIGPHRVMQKVVLGLLEAKINVLAFVQNLAQIMCSEQFLNPDFQGSLVFTQDQVRNIRNTCPQNFEAFKEFQLQLKQCNATSHLLAELDVHVGYYLDVLLEDNSLSYTKIVGQIPADLQEVTQGKVEKMPDELEDIIALVKAFFGLLTTYLGKYEEHERRLAEKKAKKGMPHKGTDVHLHIKRVALKRLIRLYREENDPLVMIKTAQNALNSIIRKGFNPKKDVLHIMSVNYGGALVGMHAKHVFARTVNRGQVLSNTGDLVYSIYDVKNANVFSELSDYPFSRVMKDNTVSSDVKREFERQNWLLVFDDNTNSGETLDNIKILAERSGFYGRIDLFPCRTSVNLSNYKNSLTDTQKLALVANSTVTTRRTKVNGEQTRYKELLGTIVGNRLWKILYAHA